MFHSNTASFELPALYDRAQVLAHFMAQRPWSFGLACLLTLVMVFMMAYGVRHMLFTYSRMFDAQRHPCLDIEDAHWPQITVFIAAHNEEQVIASCMLALLHTNYPHERMKIVPINDRSTDRTKLIIDQYASNNPSRIHPFHRSQGKPGKAAALKDALAFVEGDIVVIFDADYVPGCGLLKQLVAPFFDPEVGAVMGRVVPVNAGSNLLTRLLDMERSAGYQVDQQARMNLKTVPQFGGTVGGLRLSAVESAGGWRDDVLAEDTDMTFRLLIKGWKTVYNNRAECYEEVPEEWSVRQKQVGRWAKGHNQVLMRSWRQLLTSPNVRLRERIDGLMLLLVYALPPLLLAGWIAGLALYYMSGGAVLALFVPMLALVTYGALGNFSAFLEIVMAVLLDGHRNRIRLLPFNALCFLASMVTITRACVESLVDAALRRELRWNKTARYRKAGAQ